LKCSSPVNSAPRPGRGAFSLAPFTRCDLRRSISEHREDVGHRHANRRDRAVRSNLCDRPHIGRAPLCVGLESAMAFSEELENDEDLSGSIWCCAVPAAFGWDWRHDRRGVRPSGHDTSWRSLGQAKPCRGAGSSPAGGFVFRRGGRQHDAPWSDRARPSLASDRTGPSPITTRPGGGPSALSLRLPPFASAIRLPDNDSPAVMALTAGLLFPKTILR
jgi:hypothetical protein